MGPAGRSSRIERRTEWLALPQLDQEAKSATDDAVTKVVLPQRRHIAHRESRQCESQDVGKRQILPTYEMAVRTGVASKQ